MSLQPIGFTPAPAAPAVKSRAQKKGKNKNRGLAFYLTNIYSKFKTSELLELFEAKKSEYNKEKTTDNEIIQMLRFKELDCLRVIRKELRNREEYVEIFD